MPFGAYPVGVYSDVFLGSFCKGVTTGIPSAIPIGLRTRLVFLGVSVGKGGFVSLHTYRKFATSPH